MTSKRPAATNRIDKATAEAATLVARAFAKLKAAGLKDTVDGLAVACTKAIQGEGACVVPVTTKSFKPFFAMSDTTGSVPPMKVRVAYISSIFAQRKEAACAVLGGIGIWNENGSESCIEFKD